MEEEKISARTLRRCTTLNGMKCYRPAIKTQLTPKQILERRQFAKNFLQKDLRYLGKVLFTDETQVLLNPTDHRQRVRRPRH